MSLKDLYKFDPEKIPEIMDTIESNYKIARRVYQQLHLDISELFADFLRSMSSYEIEGIDNNIQFNRWGIRKVTEVQDAQELMKMKRLLYFDKEAPIVL